ncbi:MAG TPA: methyltransferase domain-containing protein [Longimicrobiales bacterium]|nr:methyltransferase domain-containing protein [Longimicrobiales bacterium]
MLDLIRLSSSLLFPPGGVELYRQIALLTDMSEGDEVLDVACGRGVSLEYFVRRYGVHGAGVEEDGRLVDEAEARARDEGLSSTLQFQAGRADALPYRDAIFDVSVGELGLAASCDPADAVRELVRVTKPGGAVVLVQLVWKAPVEEAQQRILAEHLGVRPLILVEWRRLMRDAGVTDIHTEGWSEDETSFRPSVTRPFPDFAEIFSLWEKVAILRRAWARWGWRGLRTVLEREWTVHRLLSRERILGLDMLKGRKAGGAEESTSGPESESKPVPGSPPPEAVSGDADARPDTAGLPLFGGARREP